MNASILYSFKAKLYQITIPDPIEKEVHDDRLYESCEPLKLISMYQYCKMFGTNNMLQAFLLFQNTFLV